MIGLEATGLKDIIKITKNASKKTMFSETLKQVAEKAEKYARDYYVPVDNGDLRKSIYLIIREDSFELGATAKHAVFNEYGCYNLETGTIAHPIDAKYKGFRPYIRPSIKRAMDEVPHIFNKNFKKAMHG